MDWIKTEALGNNRYCLNYSMDCSGIDYCDAIYNNVEFKRTEAIMVLIYAGTDGEKIVQSIEELHKAKKEGTLSSCIFRGNYKDIPIEIFIDFDMCLLKVVVGVESISDIMGNLCSLCGCQVGNEIARE